MSFHRRYMEGFLERFNAWCSDNPDRAHDLDAFLDHDGEDSAEEGESFGDSKTAYSHESYGMVGLSRQTSAGSRRMFGSNLVSNPSVISLTVHRARREHALGRDWFYAQNELLEVHLTPSQFAEMLTNPNVGFGVPCTIRHVDRTPMAEVPWTPSEAESVRQKYQTEVTDALLDKCDVQRAKLVEQVQNLSRRKQDAILRAFDQTVRVLHDHGPFLLESFQEAVQRTVVEAKQEVDAFVTHAVNAAGMEALAAGRSLQLALGEDPALTLDSGEVSKTDDE